MCLAYDRLALPTPSWNMSSAMYNTSVAFLEALKLGGVDVVSQSQTHQARYEDVWPTAVTSIRFSRTLGVTIHPFSKL